MVDAKNMTTSEIHNEMNLITLRLLNLSQELVNAKLRLEEFTKQGLFCLAKSRYNMGGPQSVSALQLPTEDWPEFESQIKVSKDECVRSEFNVRFNYFSLLSQADQSFAHVEDLGSGLVHRKPGEQSKTISNDEKVPSKDPLKWFGFLVPNTLRQSQTSYRKAVEISVECANIQNEINGVIARKKFLTRSLVKAEV